MLKVFQNTQKNSYFSITSLNHYELFQVDRTFKFLWCRNEKISLEVDGELIILKPNQILCLAPNHQLRINYFLQGPHSPIEKELSPQTEWVDNVYLMQYNRDFYCVLDHDQEISCAGLLFYGATQIPIIQLDTSHQAKITRLWEVFQDEFETKDNIQESMLNMLLKRWIIICTRLLKEQTKIDYQNDELADIRRFHILVEQHFRTKQKVSDYAELLNKSPKTLSNLFAKNNEKPPLKHIQDRIILEAKRLLLYSEKSIKEISWELNFEEVTHFSRFFKRYTHYTPTSYRKQIALEANS